LVDHATRFIADAKQVAPEKPFFMYFCPGAMHAPHQAPKEWADRYAAEFDGGWDQYRETVFARQQEIGVVPRGTDHHIGRLIAFLERMGLLEDTLILVISDNGASAEGGPHGSVNENPFFNNVPERVEKGLAAIDELGACTTEREDAAGPQRPCRDTSLPAALERCR
jgi:arylsulfatase A-like enzyme